MNSFGNTDSSKDFLLVLNSFDERHLKLFILRLLWITEIIQKFNDPFTQFPLMVTFYRTIISYHHQDIDIIQTTDVFHISHFLWIDKCVHVCVQLFTVLSQISFHEFPYTINSLLQRLLWVGLCNPLSKGLQCDHIWR